MNKLTTSLLIASAVFCSFGLTAQGLGGANGSITPAAGDGARVSMIPNEVFDVVTTRYSCADGVTLTIQSKNKPKNMDLTFDEKKGIVVGEGRTSVDKFDTASATIASERALNPRAAVDQQQRLNASQARSETTKPLSREELALQRSEFDDYLDSLDRTQPIIVKFKYKTYTLRLEQTYAGPKFIGRTQGVEWSYKNRTGTLKSTFSGRVIAANCRRGIATEQSAE